MMIDFVKMTLYSGFMVKAVFAGSFDPPTFGHLNIIERAKGIFEHIYVVVAVNKNKSGLFSPEERLEMLRSLLAPWQNVSVHLHDRLIVEFAREHDCRVLVRGVRSIHDFSYEFELSIMNKGLGPDIETIFMPTDPRYFVLRSSAIKELASFKGDLTSMVPAEVAVALRRKMEAEEGRLGAGGAHA